MTKVSRIQISSENLGHYINNLWSAFILMDSKEDVRQLFRDLFTHTEYKMLAKRLEIARRLLQGDQYQSIQRDLSVTANTITRISNILALKGDGLRKAHQRLALVEDKHTKRQIERAKQQQSPLARKFGRKPVLGAILKAGVSAIDKQIIKEARKRTASKKLSV